MLKGLQVWGPEVWAAQERHVMLAVNIEINCLSGKLLIRPSSVKIRSKGRKRHKTLLIPSQIVGGFTAKDLLSL
jgi:hypothetical protein